MTLWVNRLYPKTYAQSKPREVLKSVGDTNIYYTLPVTQNETHQTTVQNGGAQVVQNRTDSVVNTSESRVNNVNHSYTETRESRNITYQTTVQVDMVNHNQIHGEQDVRRIAQYLRDALEETLSASAEGVM